MMATEKRLIDANAKFIEKHFAKRLIDIYALIDVIENTDWYHINPQGKLVAGANSQENIPLYKASDIHRALANAPAVDVAEVVRCKDCGRGDQYANRPPYIYCMEHCKLVEKDDFCSYGERKDND
ncbi:MAG: hypothetical protein U0N82_12000 [Oscillospiraceae bacterium]